MIELRKCSECEVEKHATANWRTCSNKCRIKRKRRLDKLKQNGEMK